MSFFKSVQWFEWLLIGIVITMLGAGYILWGKYEKVTSQLGSVNVEKAILSETVKYKDASATITDEVVTTFTQNQTDAKAELEQSRKGVIDEYINMATGTVHFPVEQSTYPIAETPKVRPRPPETITTNRADGSVSDDVRIGIIAKRMHEHYCSATGGDGDNCSPVSTDKKVLR